MIRMVFIIAELGTNHMGDVKIAKEMISVAKSTGCDAVKLQKKNIEKIYTKKFLDSYLESPWGTTQREMRLYREFSEKQLSKIFQHSKKLKIPLFFSCWDIDSQIQMRKFKTKYNKVASAMLTHHKLLEVIAEEKKYTFISTGMSTMKDIEKAVKIFRKHKCPFELMHTNSSYPMLIEEANLRLIEKLKNKFKCKVGYSGHESGGDLVCVAAVLMGANSIERHITIDRATYGSDQAASLEPAGWIRLVRDIKAIEQMVGDGKKKIWESEKPIMKKLRERLV